MISAQLRGLVILAATTSTLLSCTGDKPNIIPEDPVLVSIQISGDSSPAVAGLTRELTAMGTYSNDSVVEITDEVEWGSADPSILTVDASGLATTLAAGTTSATATLGSVSQLFELTVTPAELVSVGVTPMVPSIAAGTQQQFVAMATYTDHATVDVSTTASWSSSDAGVAAVDSAGLVTSALPGLATITATFEGESSSSMLTVTDAVLVSLAINPLAQTIANGTTLQLNAVGTFTDASIQNLSSEVTWSSSMPAMASISSTGLVTAEAVGSATMTAEIGGISSTAEVTVSAAVLASIEVTPATPSVAAGTTQQFTATGTFTDSTTQDLTQTVIWGSSDDSIATVSNLSGSLGLATGMAVGTATISAQSGAVTGSTSLDVSAATLVSLAVTPAAPSIAAGTQQQFVATGTFTDASTQDLTAAVAWSSSASAIADISNAPLSAGQATGFVAGQVTITAAIGAASGQTTLDVTAAELVSIAVTPASPSIAAGTDEQFTATGTYTDASTQDLTESVAWASSNTGAASISNTAGSRGLATSSAAGTTTITATSGLVSGTAFLTVTSAELVSLAVTPAAPSIAAGTDIQFAATGTFTDSSTQDLTDAVTWASSSGAVATISNALGSEGLASSATAGSSTVSATSGLISAQVLLTVTSAELVSIAVTPAAPSIANGTDIQFAATGTYTDASTQDLTDSVTWSSSDSGVATVSNAVGSFGLATSAGTGSTTVSAASGAISGSTTLDVTAAALVSISVTPAAPSIAAGTDQQFVATGSYTDSSTQNLTDSVTWSSSNDSIATISNAAGSHGLASSSSPGSVTVTATSGAISGQTSLTVSAAALVSVAVTPAAPSIAAGTSLQFSATGTFTDSSTQDLSDSVTWASATAAVASISNAAGSEGLATSATAGSSTISATSGAISGSVELTVTAAALVSIAVTPTTPSIANGTDMQFAAVGTYTDSSTQDLTSSVSWASDDLAVASVSNAAGSEGLASSASVGSATITATLGAFSDQTTLTVSSAVLASISITPSAPSIANGTSLQLTATGTFTDGSTQDLTTQASWADSDSGAIASVSNAAGSEGLVSAAGPGTTMITATDSGSGIVGQTSFDVTAATLSSITVLPSNPSIALGTDLQFTATGNFSDSTTQDLSGQVTWLSDDSGVATVSNASGSEGFASSAGVGSANIIATFAGVSGNSLLTVSSAELVSIDVTPSNDSVALGFDRQFTATGTYTDATTQDLTASVTWSSSDGGIASVSNAVGSQGLGSSNAVGSVTISATDVASSISGSTGFTVGSAALVSVAVTPGAPSLALGSTQQFAATGTFSDGSNQDLTTVVTWSDGDSGAVASISNASGSEGLAQTAGVGSTTITASDSGVSGTATLTVTAAELVSIEVTPANQTVALGSTVQLAATGTYTDSTTQDLTTSVSWTCPGGEASIDGNGLATAASVGSCSATALDAGSGVSGSTSITVTSAALVSIDVTPATPSLPLGNSVQLSATGTYTDSTTQDLTESVTWSCGPEASISNSAGSRGLASANTVGSCNATATDSGSGVSGATALTVTAAELVSIAVTPGTPSIALGTSQQFTATGTFTDASTSNLTDSVSWSCDDAGVATVSNAAGSHGIADSVGTGSCGITALDSGSGISGSATLAVTSAEIVSIAITPPNQTIPLGNSASLTATATFTDSSTQDLTSSVTWASGDIAVATVSNAVGSEGQASSQGTGSAQITATDAASGVVGSTSLTVSSAALVSIAVTPGGQSVALGGQVQYTATGTYTDSSTADITEGVTWSCGAAATISNAAGSRGLASTAAVGTCAVTATDSSSGIDGTTSLTVTSAELVSIEVTPGDPSAALGSDVQFTATGTYTDSTTQDLTATVLWAESDAGSIATISNAAGSKGLAQAVGVGNTVVTATDSGTSIQGSTLLTVTNAALVSIAVTPSNPTDPLGSTRQFTATGTFTDSTTQDLTASVTWASDDELVATVSNAAGSQGSASTASVGSAVISATHAGSGVVGQTTYTVSAAALVSIAVTPANPTSPLGNTRQFTATGTFTDSSTADITASVTWSDGGGGSIANVSNAAGSEGLASTLGVGSTTVTATDPGSAIAGSTGFTVTAASLVSIDVTPSNPSIALGTGVQFTATGTYTDSSTDDLTDSVTWLSSDAGVATISNAAGNEGNATSIGEGSSTIVASDSASGITGSTLLTVTPIALVSIDVTPTNPSMALGFDQQFAATGTFTDSSTQDLTASVTWSSSDTGVADVSNAAGSEGLVTSNGTGSATITALDAASGISGTSDQTVTAAQLVSIEVTPATPSLALGTSQQMVATGTFTDSSTQILTASVTWSCPVAGVASISNAVGSEGLASTDAVGSCTATATDVASGISGTTMLTVTAASLVSIDVTPASSTIALGTDQQYAATGTFTDSSTQDLTASVTWSDSDSGSIATVSNAAGSRGLASSQSVGSTSITATDVASGKNGSASLTVSSAALVSIEITPDTPSLALGTSMQLTATGTFTDATTQDLTASVSWSCPVAGVASIDNTAGSEGAVTTQSVGSCTATATDVASGISDTTTLTVTAATLASIAITPADPSIAKGSTQQFTATGTFTDSSTQDLTAQVTWSSSDGAIATVSNAAGSEGLGISVDEGMVTVTATDSTSGVFATTTFTVTAAELVSIAITPANSSVDDGFTRQLSAIGTYTDSSTQDLTEQVTWASSDGAIAAISNAAGSKGLAAGVSPGSVTITAVDSVTGVNDATSLTVDP